MAKACPHCTEVITASEGRTEVQKAGFFRRKSDSRLIQRFRCRRCKKSFSNASSHPAFGQNKRQMNERLRRLLCSGVSLRRSAKLLCISRTTVKRKFAYLGVQSRAILENTNRESEKAEIVEFDDQETFEHSKCKPLSITLAVDSKSRRILGFEVSRMPAKGHLTKIAFKKYGYRKDERQNARLKLFETLKPLVADKVKFKSDQNPHYPGDLKKIFPNSFHETHKGQRGSIVGQGELKKIRFDPLFSLNHTCAMTRANMNRLFRRTWCTTKLPERLADHFAIYAVYHNQQLIKVPPAHN
jgi:transposase-like protein